jgi:hypothetical protein
MKLLLSVFFVLHFMACLWHMNADLEGPSWVRDYLGPKLHGNVGGDDWDDDGSSIDTWRVAPR